MNKIKTLYLFIGATALVFVLSGCTHDTGFKKLDFDPELIVSDKDSVIDELTPIITIGDDVSVAVYKCKVDLDCDRCHNGDVYGQYCGNGTCQGDLTFLEECVEDCSAGQCVENNDPITAEEVDGLIGEDYDLYPKKGNDDAIIDNDDLLPESDGALCSNKIEDCIGYRGIGSAYLSAYPACECKLIYVPSKCSPMDPPCPDFSSKTNYPDCACN